MIIGHQKILDFLRRSLENNKIAHAYLFIGSEHLGKKTVALEFAKMLQREEIHNHPDVLEVKPEITEKKGVKKEQEISIAKIREIQRQLSLFPFRGPYKIVLIDGADKMTHQAANALLKTLEEPTSNTVLILISSSLERLLSTIISRCLVIKFFAVSKELTKKGLSALAPPSVFLDKIVRLSNGRPGLAMNYLKNPDLDRKQNQIFQELSVLLKNDLTDKFKYAEILSKDTNLAQTTLQQWLIFFRDLMLARMNCKNLTISNSFEENRPLPQIKNIIQKIIKTQKILNKASFNSRLALEVLMLEL